MPDLSIVNNWYQIYENEEGDLSGNGNLPSVIFPVLFSDNQLKCKVTTNDNALRAAGWLTLYIGSINTPDEQVIRAQSRYLIFNEWKLITYSLLDLSISSQFFIKYQPPYYVKQYHINVYQYQETQ